jgi:hypothetical protein
MRSDQRGSVEVRGEDVRGRVYVGKKGISLATTAEDRDLHKHLVNSGYVDDAFLRKVAAGEASFSDVPDRETAIIDLLREITVESLYHLNDKGATFEVAEGAVTPYGSPRLFELEATLDDVRRRTLEWESVHEVIADLDATIKMNRDAGDQEEIKINREAWRLLCELGSGASVSVIAERLGTTEFWIAKVAAELAERELLLLSDDSAEDGVARTEPIPSVSAFPTEQVGPDQSWWVEPEFEAPETAPESSQAFPAPAAEATVTQSDGPSSEEEGKESRFGHFVRSARAESAFAADDETAAPAFDTAAPDVETAAPDVETAAPAFDTAAPDVETGHQGPLQESPALETEPEPESVEEDTEAFLEKVFSQLDSNGQVDVEEEGHGLLRRRRMGSVLKEIDED